MMKTKNDPVLASRIEVRPTNALIVPSGNPRKHPQQQIDQIAQSFLEFGMINPVAVDTAGEIIVGAARYQAALQLGWKEIPVLVLSHLSELQKRAYRIADNQIALNASWDEELLQAELEALIEQAFEVELTGIAEEELRRLLATPELQQEGNTHEDAIPEEQTQITSQPGDLWRMGCHVLLCGDATDALAIERVLGVEKASMAFTDPPYNVDYRQDAQGSRTILNDNLGSQFEAFLSAACRNILAAVDGAVYICMSSSEIDTLKRAFQSTGGHFSTFVMWIKDHFTLGRSDYQRGYEPILYGWREGTRHHWCGDRNQSDVWHFARPRVNDLHPTMKPVALVEQAITNSSPVLGIVLDPFAGSGSTLIACQRTGRKAHLVELDPKYTDVIVRRWQDFTGRQAVLDQDGRTFDEIATERLGEIQKAA